MGYLEEARQNHVKKKVEEALRSKMKAKALKECDQLCEKYAQCASGRTISVIWRCRKEASDLNECLHQYELACFKFELDGSEVDILSHVVEGYSTKNYLKRCVQRIEMHTNDTVLEEMKKRYVLEQETKENIKS